jgi:hypothetical protein
VASYIRRHRAAGHGRSHTDSHVALALVRMIQLSGIESGARSSRPESPRSPRGAPMIHLAPPFAPGSPLLGPLRRERIEGCESAPSTWRRVM